jgi:broad specificity phosphatase PhoE
VSRCILLRHAAHDLAGRALAGRMPGLGLNDAGRRQAQALAGALAARGIDAIYSSPQQRTRETAAPIAQRLSLPVHASAAFDEIDFGTWTGRDFTWLQDNDAARWRQWCEQRSEATPPGGEPFRAAAARASAGLRQLLSAHPRQTVLVVSHADVIQAAVAGCLGLGLDDLERFDLACAGLCEIEATPGGLRVLRMNEDPLAAVLRT